MQSRRDFIRFLGLSALSVGCTSSRVEQNSKLQGLEHSTQDMLELHSGLSFEILLRWKDSINSQGELFGMDADYIGLIPQSPNRAFLYVNHEAIHPQLMPAGTKKRDQMREVGGSLLEIQRKDASSAWQVRRKSVHNKRFDALTKISFSGGHKIQGSEYAIGTLANCSGGTTPWNTFLSCEENYQHYYGEREHSDSKADLSDAKFHWGDNPPEHYGWVVEIDPRTKKAIKRIELGRFAHEGATCVLSRDGKLVVYMGDDAEDRCLYKYVCSSQGFEGGTLYVADLSQGKWLTLDYESQGLLQKNFKDQLEVNIYCREAAELIGGSPLNRPEDIEVHPRTGDVYVSLTKSSKRDDPYGSILRIREENALHSSTHFEHETFLNGGQETGFSCPDNLCFDPRGNLWMTTDVSGKKIEQGDYGGFGNNGLFLIPDGSNEIIRVGTAPWAAEFTGPCFSPDGRSLFLSVQHPGEDSKSLDQLTSHWPDGGTSVPKSALVQIRGPLLDRISARSAGL